MLQGYMRETIALRSRKQCGKGRSSDDVIARQSGVSCAVCVVVVLEEEEYQSALDFAATAPEVGC